MRILNVSSLYPPNVVGGAEMGLKTMSDAMADLGHEMHVATLQPPEGIGQQHAPVNGRVRVHAVPLANIYWPFDKSARPRTSMQKLTWHSIDTSNEIMAKRVADIVRRVRPHIVLTRNLQGFSTAVMPAIRRTGVPLVHVLHDYSLVCPQTTMWRNGRGCGSGSNRCGSCRLLTSARARHTRAVDAVIGVSRSVLESHLEHGLFANAQKRVIYNALRPNLGIRKAVRSRKSGEAITFGFMGRPEPSKGIETLLDAATRMERDGLNFRLKIAGNAEPDYLRYLQANWPLDSVEYLGFVEAGEFLHSIDALVFPSVWKEALGNGVFESFSQGTPVIGSDRGGIPESIDEGVTGFVFTGGNVDELHERMLRLVDQPALIESMGERALTKALEYQPEHRAREYLSFLDTVADFSAVAN